MKTLKTEAFDMIKLDDVNRMTGEQYRAFLKTYPKVELSWDLSEDGKELQVSSDEPYYYNHISSADSMWGSSHIEFILDENDYIVAICIIDFENEMTKRRHNDSKRSH